jgi:uncharacterized membrane protein
MVEEGVYLKHILGSSIVIIQGSRHFSVIMFYFIQSNCCRDISQIKVSENRESSSLTYKLSSLYSS